jgi:hypothetical protein
LNRHFYGTGNGPWNIDFLRKGVIPHNRAWVSFQDKTLEEYFPGNDPVVEIPLPI